MNHFLAQQSKPIQKIFGTIESPDWIPKGKEPLDLLVTILNVALNLTMIIAGFVTLINFIRAGYTFMTAGADPKKLEEAQHIIKWSAVGLLVVVLAPLAAAIIGYIVFKDPMAIIQPKIYKVL